jgi:hypothetical protein
VDLIAPGFVTGGERVKAIAGSRIPNISFDLYNGKVNFLTEGEKITVALNKKLTGVDSRQC